MAGRGRAHPRSPGVLIGCALGRREERACPHERLAGAEGSLGERRVCARAWLSPPLTPPPSDKGQAVWAWTSAFADFSHGGT